MNSDSDIRHTGMTPASERRDWLDPDQDNAATEPVEIPTKITVTVEGRPRHETTWKSALALMLVVLGGVLCYLCAISVIKGEALVGLGGTVGLFLILSGLWLPQNKHTYRDPGRRELVSESHYAGIETSKARRPFASFGAIVARHLVHHDEGGDSYTGSVGFKPVGTGSVVWLKHFSASADEIPAEAHAYALDLHMLTGIPMPPLTTPQR